MVGIAAHERQLGRDARIGDDDVEPAERLDRRLDDGVHLASVADVARPPRRVTGGGHLGEEVSFETGEGDPRPCACRRCASAAPIPRAAPVMRTRRPESDGEGPNISPR